MQSNIASCSTSSTSVISGGNGLSEGQLSELCQKYPRFNENNFLILHSLQNYIYPPKVNTKPIPHAKIKTDIKLSHHKDTSKYSNPDSKTNHKPTSNKGTIHIEKEKEKVIHVFNSNFLVEQTLKAIDSPVIIEKLDIQIGLSCGKILKANEVYARCYDCECSLGLSNNAYICAECFENSDHSNHRTQLFKLTNSELIFCRCGDIEFLNQKGFCKEHGNNTSTIIEKILSEFPALLKSTCENILFEVFYGFFAVTENIIENPGNKKHLVNTIFEMIYEYINSLISKNKAFIHIVGRIFFSQLPPHLNYLRHNCSNVKTLSISTSPKTMATISNSNTGISIESSSCSCTIFENIMRYKSILNANNLIKLQDLMNKMASQDNRKIDIMLGFVKMYHLVFNSNKLFSDLEMNPDFPRLSLYITGNSELVKAIIISPYINNLFEMFDIFLDKFSDKQDATTERFIQTLTDNIMLLLEKKDNAQIMLLKTNFLPKYMNTIRQFWFKFMYLSYVIEPFDSVLISSTVHEFLKNLMIVEENFSMIYQKLLGHLSTNNDYKDFTLIFTHLGEMLELALIDLQNPDTKENGIFPSNILVRILCMTYRTLYEKLDRANIQQFLGLVFKNIANPDYHKEVLAKFLWTTLRTILMIKIMQKRNNSEKSTVWSKYLDPGFNFMKYDLIFCQMALLFLDQDTISNTLLNSIFFYDSVRLNEGNNNGMIENEEWPERIMILSHLMLKNKELLTQQSYQEGLNIIDDWLQVLICIINDELCFCNTIPKLPNNAKKSDYSSDEITKKAYINLITSILHKQSQYTISLKKVEELVKLCLTSEDEIDKWIASICDIDHINKRISLKEKYRDSYDYFLYFHLKQTNLFQPSITEIEEFGSQITDCIQRKNLEYATDHIYEIQRKFFESNIIDEIMKLLISYDGITNQNSASHSANFFRIVHMHLDLILNGNITEKSLLKQKFESIYLKNTQDLYEIKEYWNSNLMPNYKNEEAGRVYLNGLIDRIEKEYLCMKTINKIDFDQSKNQRIGEINDVLTNKKKLIKARNKEIQEAFKLKQLKALDNITMNKTNQQHHDTTSTTQQEIDGKPLEKKQESLEMTKEATTASNSQSLELLTCLVCNEKIEKNTLAIPLIVFHTNFNYDPNEYLPFQISLKNTQSKPKGPTEVDKPDKIKAYIQFTSCGHRYHAICLKDNSKCPYCRQNWNFLLVYQEFPSVAWIENSEGKDTTAENANKEQDKLLKTLKKPTKIQPLTKKLPVKKPESKPKPPPLASPFIEYIFAGLGVKDSEKLMQTLIVLRKIIIQLCKKSQYVQDHMDFIQKNLMLYKTIIDHLERYVIYSCRHYHDYPVRQKQQHKTQDQNIFHYFIEEMNKNPKNESDDQSEQALEALSNHESNLKPSPKSSSLLKNPHSLNQKHESKSVNDKSKIGHLDTKGLNEKTALPQTQRTSPSVSSKVSTKAIHTAENISTLGQTTKITVTNTPISSHLKRPISASIQKPPTSTTKLLSTPRLALHEPRPTTSDGSTSSSKQISSLGSYSSIHQSHNLKKGSKGLNTSLISGEEETKKASKGLSTSFISGDEETKEEKKQEVRQASAQSTGARFEIRNPVIMITDTTTVANTIKLLPDNLIGNENRQDTMGIEENLSCFIGELPNQTLQPHTHKITLDSIGHINLWAVDINMHYVDYFFNLYATHIIAEKVTEGTCDPSLVIQTYTAYYMYLIYLVSLPKILPRDYFPELTESHLKDSLNTIKTTSHYLESLKSYLLQACKTIFPLTLFYGMDLNHFEQALLTQNHSDLDFWIGIISPGLSLTKLLEVSYPKFINEEYLVFNIWKKSVNRWLMNTGKPVLSKVNSFHTALIDLPGNFQEFWCKYQKEVCKANGEISANLCLCLLCGYISCRGSCRKNPTQHSNGNLQRHAIDIHCGESAYLNLITMNIELYAQNKGSGRFINKLYTDVFGKSPCESDAIGSSKNLRRYTLDMNILNTLKKWIEFSNIGKELSTSQRPDLFETFSEFM